MNNIICRVICLILIKLMLFSKVIVQSRRNVSHGLVLRDQTYGHDGDSNRDKEMTHAREIIRTAWPMGVIPYYFNSSYYDFIVLRNVRFAMNKVQGKSCVKFEEIHNKPSKNMTWIHFANPDRQRGCNHKPLRSKKGEIRVVLGYDCLKSRDILHSLLHAIGFKDEVTHPQRDQYVRVLWDNIHPAYRDLYRLQPESDISPLLEYDPLSVMHFHDRAYTMNGHATVATLVPGLQINPSDVLSHLDEMKLRLLFGHECNKRRIGDMLDTCKMALHKNTTDSDERNDYSATNSSEVNDVNSDKETDNETSEVRSKEKDNTTSETMNKDKEIDNVTTEKNSDDREKDNVTSKNRDSDINIKYVFSNKKGKEKQLYYQSLGNRK